jgi:sigma-B regulation protein RsbU (phosphoserine phosphatase)
MLKDLKRAKKLKSLIFQQDLPNDPRLRLATFLMPHDILGGDYYAMQQLDENRFGFMLADSEGHGVAAALYTMHLSMRNCWASTDLCKSSKL